MKLPPPLRAPLYAGGLALALGSAQAQSQPAATLADPALLTIQGRLAPVTMPASKTLLLLAGSRRGLLLCAAAAARPYQVARAQATPPPSSRATLVKAAFLHKFAPSAAHQKLRLNLRLNAAARQVGLGEAATELA